jgi:hypothetical protein
MPARSVAEVVSLAVEAEASGFDPVWVYDEGLAVRDCYITLTAIALAAYAWNSVLESQTLIRVIPEPAGRMRLCKNCPADERFSGWVYHYLLAGDSDDCGAQLRSLMKLIYFMTFKFLCLILAPLTV